MAYFYQGAFCYGYRTLYCKGESNDDCDEENGGEEVGPPSGGKAAGMVNGNGDGLANVVLLPECSGYVECFGLGFSEATLGVGLTGSAGGEGCDLDGDEAFLDGGDGSGMLHDVLIGLIGLIGLMA